jgi:thiol:disulfide interchange protein
MQNTMIRSSFGFILSLLLLAGGVINAQFDNPVTWNYRVGDPADGKQEVVFNATIAAPWHVYAIKLEKEGPIPTTFTFEENPSLVREGELKELIKPVLKFDEGFRFDVGMYAKKASFSQTIRNITAEPAKLKVSIEFQCCNDETCLPPFTQEFVIDIAAGPVTAKSASDAPVKSPEKTLKPEKAEVKSPEIKAEEPAKVSIVATPEVVTGKEPVSAPAEDKQSMLLFLLISFLAGLAAILTPCVFPMIPMTISFFMRGSENRGPAIVKGIVFGLSMILVYTGIGVLVSLTGMNADIGNMLSTHWIPNIIFFILFMVFAASFLGMFELVLPSGLVNSADRNADRGGIIGAFFMGVTTVLVSFSCTGPIVGSLLISAAGGEVLKPVLGMLFFSLAFALPFTLLAIFPSMLKNLPKSGGWLNSIKVVLGFVVLAFGMKFLASIDQSYHLGIFSREVYLAVWLVISVFLGLYLMGKLRLAHDNEMPYLTVPRLIMAIASFVFAIYLFTGILGADLKTISALIPPKSASAFKLNMPAQRGGNETGSANYCGPGKYDDLFELPLDLKGYFDYEEGIKCAKARNKPVFLEFTGHFCSNCKQMENQVWPETEVLQQLKNDFVIISLYTDDKTKVSENEYVTDKDGRTLKSLGDINKNFETVRFSTIATPLYVILDSDGNALVSPSGKDLNVASFARFLRSGVEAFNKK